MAPLATSASPAAVTAARQSAAWAPMRTAEMGSSADRCPASSEGACVLHLR